MDLGREILTNEAISKKFKSQFDLVEYAIRLATNMIHSGRESRVKTDIQNRAMQALIEIRAGKDEFDEIIYESESVSHEEGERDRDRHQNPKFRERERQGMNIEKKKSRRVAE